MTKSDHSTGQARRGDHIVRTPRVTDAIGHALRGAFVPVPLPVDMVALVNRLDRVTHH